MTEIRIGTSGYQYDHWRDLFYPTSLPKKDWFTHYTEHFDTVEINNTFYSLPSVSTFDRWREESPEGFCFSLKFSRYGSHLKHLKDPQDTIETFMDHARRLRDRLGPILVQLPPRWAPDIDRLSSFLAVAPADQRWAVEFRDRRWLCQSVYDVLREHGAALCIHDMIENHPREITSDWTYLRYHGDHYQGCYSHQFLTAEAQRIVDWVKKGLAVYAYFNNDIGGHAVTNATDLRRYVENAMG